VWTDIFYALTGSTGRVGTTAIDSTHVKAHRSAGAKGGPERRLTDQKRRRQFGMVICANHLPPSNSSTRSASPTTTQPVAMIPRIRHGRAIAPDLRVRRQGKDLTCHKSRRRLVRAVSNKIEFIHLNGNLMVPKSIRLLQCRLNCAQQ
jgi:hypothetical protein